MTIMLNTGLEITAYNLLFLWKSKILKYVHENGTFTNLWTENS